eukprot:TRINITY_DN30969_c0_g1_i1.p1 TRINITY_DN30969_c0_g1~~TRINITY_DN30969_c0_g1_i1.p1  ORF type:complete len:302 (+),score=31.68 TRINITY_DN30969_c0_g1_i1:59-907(+)
MASKYPMNDAVRGVSYQGQELEATFTEIYATNAWGRGSGAGSLPIHCLKWIEFVRTFIRDKCIDSVVDLGCGDWQFSPYIYHDLNVKYVGYDVVFPLIEENRARWSEQGYRFEHLEFSSKVPDIEEAELYILKDVLQHWSSARITAFLSDVLSSKQKLRFVLVCNCSEPDDWPEDDILDGGWRPLVAARSPLKEFEPEVMMYFQSLPNKKEISVLRPAPRVDAAVPCPGQSVSCAACGRKPKARSGSCELDWYCSPECQRSEWKHHGSNCKRRSEPASDVST